MLSLASQSCPTLCEPMDCSPTGSSSPWGFARHEYWKGLPCSLPGDLPNPGIGSRSPALQVDSLPSEPQGKPYCKNLTYAIVEAGKPVSVMWSSSRILEHEDLRASYKEARCEVGRTENKWARLYVSQNLCSWMGTFISFSSSPVHMGLLWSKS